MRLVGDKGSALFLSPCVCLGLVYLVASDLELRFSVSVCVRSSQFSMQGNSWPFPRMLFLAKQPQSKA